MNRTPLDNLESPRLLLRRFEDGDLGAFLAYRNDPLVARYQSWERHTEQEAKEIIQQQKALELGLPGQWFQFAIQNKETGQLIGDCGLKIKEGQVPYAEVPHPEVTYPEVTYPEVTYPEVPHAEMRQAEIGFTLSRQYQGQGFATEAVSRILDYAFVTLKLHRVIAITDCENEASVRLLERLAMRREGHFIQNVWFKGKWGDEYLYAILAGEWRGAR